MSQKIVSHFTSSRIYIIMLCYIAFGTILFLVQGTGHNIYEYIASVFTNKKYICVVLLPSLFVLSSSLYTEMSHYSFILQRLSSRKQVLSFYLKNLLSSSFILLCTILLLVIIVTNLFGTAAYEIVSIKVMNGQNLLYNGLNVIYLVFILFRMFFVILILQIFSLFLQFLFKNAKMVILLEGLFIILLYFMAIIEGPLYFTFLLPSMHIYSFLEGIALHQVFLLDLLYYFVVSFFLYKGCLFLIKRKDSLVIKNV